MTVDDTGDGARSDADAGARSDADVDPESETDVDAETSGTTESGAGGEGDGEEEAATADTADTGPLSDEELARAVAENPEAVAALVRRLELVNELLDVAALGTAALDDEMVTSLARTANGLGEVVDAAADPDTVRGIETLLSAVGEASAGSTPPARLGPLGLLGALRDPDVQRGLGFVVAVSRAAGRDLSRREER